MRCKLAGAGANRGGRQLMGLGRERGRGQFRCGQRGKCRHEVETREFKQEKIGESVQFLDTSWDLSSWLFTFCWSDVSGSLVSHPVFSSLLIKTGAVQIPPPKLNTNSQSCKYQTFTLEYESLSQVSLQSVWSSPPLFAHLKFCHCPFLWRLLVLKEI